MWTKVHDLLREGLERQVYPCAAIAVGHKDHLLYREMMGNRSVYPQIEPLTNDTRFDMASLTKLMATTFVALSLIEEGKLNLDDPLSRYFETPMDKASITIQALMTHTSGISPHFMLSEVMQQDQDVTQVILNHPLEYATGQKVEYSCMGYILLGKILEKVGADRLDRLAKTKVFEPLGMMTTDYCPSQGPFATTEWDEVTSHYIQGVVHDENARFLQGISGNAGVFSTLDDCIRFGAMLSQRGELEGHRIVSQEMFDCAVENYTRSMNLPRGLGFNLNGMGEGAEIQDTLSYGHTGFTGTSMWVDQATGLYVVLLTNRVHYGRDNVQIIDFRRVMHRMIRDEIFPNLSM